MAAQAARSTERLRRIQREAEALYERLSHEDAVKVASPLVGALGEQRACELAIAKVSGCLTDRVDVRAELHDQQAIVIEVPPLPLPEARPEPAPAPASHQPMPSRHQSGAKQSTVVYLGPGRIRSSRHN